MASELTYQECKYAANQALGLVSFAERREWWTTPHTELDNREPFIAIFDPTMRERIVKVAFMR